MHAVVIDEWGAPDVLHEAEVPDPGIGPKDLLIRVAAAAVNPADISARQGRSAMAVEKASFPLVLGWDAAGTVEAVGEEVEGFSVGDRVLGMAMWLGGFVGTYAELAALDYRFCAPMPDGIEHPAASTIPLCGLTAWSALEVADVQPGETLLVTGAAGGVGGDIVQIARSRGLDVIGFARTADADTVLGFGAKRFTDEITSVDNASVAIDTTANPDLALRALKPGSRLVTISGKASSEPDAITISTARVRRDPAALESLCAMAAKGDLALKVHREFPLANAKEAHSVFEAGGVRGRLVLLP